MRSDDLYGSLPVTNCSKYEAAVDDDDDDDDDPYTTDCRLSVPADNNDTINNNKNHSNTYYC